MSLNCIICDERVNKARHALVCCPYCAFEACRACCETYVLDKTIAQCMNTSCGKEWTRKQIAAAFTKSFINGKLKQHREKVLFDREVALLPATQPLVEEAIRKDQGAEHMKDLKETVFLIEVTHKHRQNLLSMATVDVALVRELDDTIATLQERHDRIMGIITELRNYVAPKERKVFVRACPDENCRGFLSTQWKCGLCEQYSCPDCHVVKGKHRDCGHTCNPDDVATAQLLAKDTKTCPSCATSIFKISGCDQMWCTQCRTAFSWKTGLIETHIHNPHYYDWLRQNNGGVAPRNPGDNGGCAAFGALEMSIYDILRIKTNSDKKKLLDPKSLTLSTAYFHTYMRVSHLRQVDLPRYRVDHVENNAGLRIKYMRNLISKEEFQKQVQQANKRYEKKREIYEVIQLLITAVTDILFRFKQNIIECDDTEFEEAFKTLLEIDKITEYTNECLLDIANTYNSKPKKIVDLEFDKPVKA
jgi:RNase P protein component